MSFWSGHFSLSLSLTETVREKWASEVGNQVTNNVANNNAIFAWAVKMSVIREGHENQRRRRVDNKLSPQTDSNPISHRLDVEPVRPIYYNWNGAWWSGLWEVANVFMQCLRFPLRTRWHCWCNPFIENSCAMCKAALNVDSLDDMNGPTVNHHVRGACPAQEDTGNFQCCCF